MIATFVLMDDSSFVNGSHVFLKLLLVLVPCMLRVFALYSSYLLVLIPN